MLDLYTVVYNNSVYVTRPTDSATAVLLIDNLCPVEIDAEQITFLVFPEVKLIAHPVK